VSGSPFSSESASSSSDISQNHLDWQAEDEECTETAAAAVALETCQHNNNNNNNNNGNGANNNNGKSIAIEIRASHLATSLFLLIILHRRNVSLNAIRYSETDINRECLAFHLWIEFA
jgi:hypothetical protein